MKNILSILLLTITNFAIANIYYVSTSGNDFDSGSESTPWKTIQKAANTLIAGDTVLIKAGVYNERVILLNSGTLDNPIVYQNYMDDIVTIDGTGIIWGDDWNGLVDIFNLGHITLDGIKVMNAHNAGFFIESGNNIHIKNCATYNTFSSGIGIWNSHSIQIENNEVELACNDGGQECITIATSSNCNIFKNNVHHNGAGTNGGEGIDVKQGSFDVNIYQNSVHHLNNRIGIYADAWDTHTYSISIYQNIIHHCSESGLAVASENGGLIENVVISNNLIYLNQYGGIEIGDWSDIGFTGIKPIKNIKIINNTCYKNGQYNSGWGYGISVENPDAEDIIIRNNICSKNSAQIAIEEIGTAAIVDHNLLFGNNITPGTLFGTDSIVGDPLFVDTIAFDFHLQNSSPAIDMGSDLFAPDRDFDGVLRPYGSHTDIGAFEFDPTSNSLESSPITSIHLYPNPYKDQLTIVFNGKNNQIHTLFLYDSSGKLIRKTETSPQQNGTIILNRDGLVAGLYILYIRMEDHSIYQKKIMVMD